MEKCLWSDRILITVNNNHETTYEKKYLDSKSFKTEKCSIWNAAQFLICSAKIHKWSFIGSFQNNVNAKNHFCKLDRTILCKPSLCKFGLHIQVQTEVEDFIFHVVVFSRETFQTLAWKFLLCIPKNVFRVYIFPNFVLV